MEMVVISVKNQNAAEARIHENQERDIAGKTVKLATRRPEQARSFTLQEPVVSAVLDKSQPAGWETERTLSV